MHTILPSGCGRRSIQVRLFDEGGKQVAGIQAQGMLESMIAFIFFSLQVF